MILHRLCEAAQRFDFPPLGYERRLIPWLMDVSLDGECLGFVRTSAAAEGQSEEAQQQPKHDPGREYEQPFIDRSSNIEPQLLADRVDYALGWSEKITAKVQARHEAFLALLRECAADLAQRPSTRPEMLAAVQAVLKALETQSWRHPRQGEFPPRELGEEDVITFRVDGQLLIEQPEIREFWARYIRRRRAERSSLTAFCLVCGETKPIADRHPLPLKGIPGGQRSGCVLVGTNAAAFESYGRKAALVSPVCWDCAETYARVLNKLLSDPDHSYRYRLADRLIYVFWTREPSDFDLHKLFFTPESKQVKALLESVAKGRRATLDPNQFYALALSGSGGRAVIRDWLETTVGHVQANLARYFAAQAIVGPNGEPSQPLGLYNLLFALLPTQSRNPWQELPPNLPAQFVHAVLQGDPLPDTLLYRAVARARAEQHVSPARAALIKLCLLWSVHKEEGLELTEALNSQLQDPAYLCGRLLAILERIQEAAVPGAKATLIDKYYGTASTAPASVFGLLMRQAQAHLAKLRKEKKPAYERLQQALEEVAGRLSDFPIILPLNEQGKFALGYYQQRAADRAARAEAMAAKQAAAADAANANADDATLPGLSQ